MAFTIKVQDDRVRAALSALASRTKNMSGVTKALAESAVERAKHRFDTCTDPDGVEWEPNKDVTLALFGAHTATKSSYRRKNGELNKAGRAVVANKRPLTGHSRNLRNQIFYNYDGQSATVIAGMPYAAIQNFGGRTGANSWIPGALIPARPFMGVRPDGTLYDSDRAAILEALNDYFTADLT